MVELRGEQMNLDFLHHVSLCASGRYHAQLNFFQSEAEWKHFEETIDKFDEEQDLLNDYYSCLIECDDDQATCKRICREVLD